MPKERDDFGMPWYQHLYWSIRYGKWSIGFATRKSWPNKVQWGLHTDYYDGHHWALHVGPFYVGASYY